MYKLKSDKVYEQQANIEDFTARMTKSIGRTELNSFCVHFNGGRNTESIIFYIML